MADGRDASRRRAAEEALDGLHELGADFREAAIFDEAGNLLAASTDAEWEARMEELWAAARDQAEELPSQLHIAVEAGELFAARSARGMSIVAITPRFALESLMFCDLRATLRELDAGVPAAA